MDTRNRFHTSSTWRWVQGEHLLGLGALCLLLALHWRQVRPLPFVAAFLVIDLVGYVPGAVAYRRAGGGPIAPAYHHLYNLTHSLAVAGAALALWVAVGGPEWAMLAVSIHLLGDRGIFGNTYKPLELPFEPAPVEGPRALALLRGEAP